MAPYWQQNQFAVYSSNRNFLPQSPITTRIPCGGLNPLQSVCYLALRIKLANKVWVTLTNFTRGLFFREQADLLAHISPAV